MGYPWSQDEDAILQKWFETLNDKELSAKLLEYGYKRNKSAVFHRRTRSGLYRPHHVRGPKPGYKVPEQSYWNQQRAADDAFQRALYAAGVRPHTSQAQATERPLIVSRPVAVRSSGYGDAF